MQVLLLFRFETHKKWERQGKCRTCGNEIFEIWFNWEENNSKNTVFLAEELDAEQWREEEKQPCKNSMLKSTINFHLWGEKKPVTSNQQSTMAYFTYIAEVLAHCNVSGKLKVSSFLCCVIETIAVPVDLCFSKESVE